MTTEQNTKWHIANGFHAFVLTDHNTCKANEEILSLQDKYPEIIIIPGIEWTTLRLHMNFIGIKNYPLKIPIVPTDEEIQNAIKKAHDMGAIVQVDHVTWTLEDKFHREYDHPTREQLIEWGVDGFEIYNEMRWHDPKTELIISQLEKNRPLDRRLFLSTGTDIHNPILEYSAVWTELLLTPEEKANPNIEIILNALKESRTKIWIDNDFRYTNEALALKLEENSLKKKILSPFYGLKDMLKNAPGGKIGIFSIVIWLLLLYFPFRLLFVWLGGI
jgi:hypothetical protein